MARYIGAFLLAAIVVWSGEARGACAWVLWGNSGTLDPDAPIELGARVFPSDWQPTKAFDTAEACETVRKEAERDEWKIFLAKRNENKPKGARWDTFVYRCLPDTIDPRGPKGTR